MAKNQIRTGDLRIETTEAAKFRLEQYGTEIINELENWLGDWPDNHIFAKRLVHANLIDGLIDQLEQMQREI